MVMEETLLTSNTKDGLGTPEHKIVKCKDCVYYIPYKDAIGYGKCQSNHTFNGAFRDEDFCSYAKSKDAQN